MTATIPQFPAITTPTAGKHAAGKHGTLPFVDLAKALGEAGERRVSHRQHAPEEMAVTDLMPPSGDLPEPGPRWGAWAWWERLVAWGRRLFGRTPDADDTEPDPDETDAATEVIPAVPQPAAETPATDVEEPDHDPADTLPVLRPHDVAAIHQAAGARGLIWDVDVQFDPEPCRWCEIDGALTCMRVCGYHEREVCRDCGPIVIELDPTTDDIVIQIPGYVLNATMLIYGDRRGGAE